MSSQNYALMKFNILSLALHPEMGDRLDDAYVHAWDSNVYPIFHDGAPWHQAFADDFEVSKEMMEELTRYLDSEWLPEGGAMAPTFYELESRYGTRHGGGAWHRGTLIDAMRYCALSRGRFDANFFQQVTRDSQAPAEANSFAEPMDRENDIYFM